MRILVVDPGKMTGWGFLVTVEGTPPTFDGYENEHFTFLDLVEPWIPHVDKVVCESFSVRADTQKTVGGDRLYSAEQIGCLRLWARRAGIPYVEQTPVDMKTFDKGKEKTKKLGWWAEPRGSGYRGHRRDAASHALLYAVRNNLIDPRRLL